MIISISVFVHADVFLSLFTFTHPAESRSLHLTMMTKLNDMMMVPVIFMGFAGKLNL